MVSVVVGKLLVIAAKATGERSRAAAYCLPHAAIARVAAGVLGSKVWLTRKNKPGRAMKIGPGGESERGGSGNCGKPWTRMHLAKARAAMNWLSRRLDAAAGFADASGWDCTFEPVVRLSAEEDPQLTSAIEQLTTARPPETRACSIVASGSLYARPGNTRVTSSCPPLAQGGG